MRKLIHTSSRQAEPAYAAPIQAENISAAFCGLKNIRDIGGGQLAFSEHDGSVYENYEYVHSSGSSELILRLGARRRIAAVYVLVHEDDPTTMKQRIKSAQMNH